MRDRGSEKRRFERYEFPLPIEFCVGTEDAGTVERGVLVNISLTGMSAYFFSPLRPGQKITFKSTLPIDCRIATVQWIKEHDERFFLAGLKFTDHYATV